MMRGPAGRVLGGVRRILNTQDGGFLFSRGAADVAARLTGVVLLFAWNVLLTRLMGAEDYGRFVYLQSAVFVASLIGALGMPTLASYAIPRYKDSRRPRRLATFLLFITAVSIAGPVAAVAALWAGVQAVGYTIFDGFPLWLVLVFSAAAALVQVFVSVDRALERVVACAVAEQVWQRIAAMVPYGLLIFGAGLAATPSMALVGATCGSLGAFVAMAWVAWRELGRLARRDPPPGPAPRTLASARALRLAPRWLGLSTVMMITPVFYYVLSESDLLILGHFAAPATVGIYQVARRVAGFMRFFSLAVTSVGIHRFSTAHMQGDHARLQRIADSMAVLGLLPAAGLWLLLAVTGPWVLALFGPEMHAGYLTLMIMCTAGMADIILGPSTELLIMTGHERLVSKVNIVFAIFTIALTFAVVPVAVAHGWGMEGAALANGGAAVLWKATLMILARRRMGIETCILLRPRAALASLHHPGTGAGGR